MTDLKQLLAEVRGCFAEIDKSTKELIRLRDSLSAGADVVETRAKFQVELDNIKAQDQRLVDLCLDIRNAGGNKEEIDGLLKEISSFRGWELKE